MKNNQKALPKMMPGVVCVQKVRCGKPNCRCAASEKHLAYYRFWREDGRLRKAYVRRDDLEQTRIACARWKEADSIMAGLLNSPAAQEQKRQTRRMLREAVGGNMNENLIRRLTR